MDIIKQVQEKFIQNLKQIDQMTKIGFDVGDILLQLLESSKKEYGELAGFIPFKHKIDRDLILLKKLKIISS